MKRRFEDQEGRWNNAQGRGRDRGRGRRRRSAGPGAADPPTGAAVAAPPLAGTRRSLQLRLRLLDQPPAQPERLGDGVVGRLKADAYETSVLELESR
jgi:hypothetical protein